jgi:hypothetical protein
MKDIYHNDTEFNTCNKEPNIKVNFDIEQILGDDGIFDKISNKVKQLIHDEYDDNRIKGKEYAELYLGGIQAIIDKAITYKFEEYTREVDIELKVREIALKEVQIKQAEEAVVSEKLQQKLYDKQIDKALAEIQLLDAQLEEHKKNMKIKDKELDLKDKDLSIKDSQLATEDLNRTRKRLG